MSANKIKVICKNDKIHKVSVWDADGKKYDASSIVTELVGSNPACCSCFRLHAAGNHITNDPHFQSSKKTMILDVDTSVIAKFISMGAEADSSSEED